MNDQPFIHQYKFDELFIEQAERNIALKCLNKTQLRASKPDGDTFCDQMAKYVWRTVAFCVSTNPQHHCMPVMAFVDLPAFEIFSGTMYVGDYDYTPEYTQWLHESHQYRTDRIKECDAISDKLIDCFSLNDWHGVKRWANVLGNIQPNNVIDVAPARKAIDMPSD